MEAEGIRKVERSEDVESSFISASNEARSVFGDGECYIEKYLNPVKHVEMQILCDNYGNVISLGERECSVQRKNQKLIEESPSPAVNDAIRAKMTEASVKAAKASGYRGAGTIEYLLDKSGNFYFMEMNTRLQVEHAVSEMVTGIDIVKWQIRIAAGAEITFTQNDIKIDGCAMECRINAEDPYDNFRPCAGKITLLHVPGGPNVRFDSALYQGYEIPPFYDSMIGKVIVCAKTREETIRKMQAALCELVVEGVEHNSELQMEILNDKDFMTGEYYTNFMTDKNLI